MHFFHTSHCWTLSPMPSCPTHSTPSTKQSYSVTLVWTGWNSCPCHLVQCTKCKWSALWAGQQWQSVSTRSGIPNAPPADTSSNILALLALAKIVTQGPRLHVIQTGRVYVFTFNPTTEVDGVSHGRHLSDACKHGIAPRQHVCSALLNNGQNCTGMSNSRNVINDKRHVASSIRINVPITWTVLLHSIS